MIAAGSVGRRAVGRALVTVVGVHVVAAGATAAAIDPVVIVGGVAPTRTRVGEAGVIITVVKGRVPKRVVGIPPDPIFGAPRLAEHHHVLLIEGGHTGDFGQLAILNPSTEKEFGPLGIVNLHVLCLHQSTGEQRFAGEGEDLHAFFFGDFFPFGQKEHDGVGLGWGGLGDGAGRCDRSAAGQGGERGGEQRELEGGKQGFQGMAWGRGSDPPRRVQFQSVKNRDTSSHLCLTADRRRT